MLFRVVRTLNLMFPTHELSFSPVSTFVASSPLDHRQTFNTPHSPSSLLGTSPRSKSHEIYTSLPRHAPTCHAISYQCSRDGHQHSCNSSIYSDQLCLINSRPRDLLDGHKQDRLMLSGIQPSTSTLPEPTDRALYHLNQLDA